MELRPGQKLHSAVCDAQVVIVRAPSADVALACGGAPLLADGEEGDGTAALDPSLGDGPPAGQALRGRRSAAWSCCAPGRARAP